MDYIFVSFFFFFVLIVFFFFFFFFFINKFMEIGIISNKHQNQ